MIYVYAISEAGSPETGEQAGLGGARLRRTVCDGVAAIFSRHRTLRPRPERRTMWSHEAVVEELMRRGPVLPLRFGTMLPDEEALQAILARRHEELRSGLERVRGCVELSVRVVDAQARTRPARERTGRAFLMARRDAHRRAERAAGELHEPLAAVSRDARLRPPAPPAIFAAAYLVEQPNLRTFKACVRALAAERDDVSIVGTGPWPPYSFVPELGG